MNSEGSYALSNAAEEWECDYGQSTLIESTDLNVSALFLEVPAEIATTLSTENHTLHQIEMATAASIENQNPLQIERATTASTASQTLQQVAQEELLKEMECPVCYKYMVLVIEECSNGHCICSSCRKNISSCPQCKAVLSGHRNRLAESIAAKLIFPCQNAECGCPEMLNGSNLLEHQSTCPWRMYNCFIPNCEWIGRSYDILDHFKVEHNANLLNGKENTIVWRNVNFETFKKACYLININEDLFIYIQEVIQKNKIFAHSVQYIGMKENASDFQYKLEFVSNDKKRQAVFIDSVMDDTVTKIFENGSGLQMAISFIQSFVDDENKIVQKLEIVAMK